MPSSSVLMPKAKLLKKKKKLKNNETSADIKDSQKTDGKREKRKKTEEQHDKSRKRKKPEDGSNLEDVITDRDQDDGSNLEDVITDRDHQDDGVMREKKKRKESFELEKTNHQEGFGNEQRRKKKKKSKKKEKSLSSKTKVQESPNTSVCKEKLCEKESKEKKLENKEPTRKPKLSKPVSDIKKNLESKKGKKTNEKQKSVENTLHQESDINPIHFEWNPSEEIKEKYKLREGKWTKKEEKHKNNEKSADRKDNQKTDGKRVKKKKTEEQHDKSRKRKKPEDGSNLEDVITNRDHQDDGVMRVKKKRRKSFELEKTNHQEGSGHEHRRKKKKKKKSKKKEKSLSSKTKVQESPNTSVCKEKLCEKESKEKKLENKEPTRKPKLSKPVSDIKKKLESKKGKKTNGKQKSVENTLQESDINPIHFEWNPSEEMKEKYKLREGKWTKKEEKILRENMERYLSENNLEDPSKLIFSHIHSESAEAKKWKEFARTTNFYRELGKGINRRLFLIYRKVLRLFDQENYVGKFSEEEDRELEKLVALHGKKWAIIGRMMGRSGMSVCHRYMRITGERGSWKDSEIDLLREAVRKVTNTADNEEVFTNINWNVVSSIVKTRNSHQCRKKWLSYVCWKDCKISSWRRWGASEDLQLIKRVYESSVTEECDIDWYKLQKDFDMARSPEWLRLKFNVILKKCCNWMDLENTDFEDIIDYLYNVKRKELEDKVLDHQDESQE